MTLHIFFFFFFFFFLHISGIDEFSVVAGPIEDVAVRRGFSIIGSGVEDQISDITILNFLLHIPVARCLNHSRKENLYFWLIITGR